LIWLPVPEAIAAIDRGDIRDAKSIIGLFSLERLRARKNRSTDDGNG